VNRLRRVLRRGAIAAAVLGALLALTLVLFLLPPIVHLLIDASGAPQVLGVEGSVAHGLSDQLVRDLLTGGMFDARLDGDVFLRSSERSHLVDVSRLFRALLACRVVASARLCWLGLRRKSWLFQGLRCGALLLGLGAALVGAAFVMAFDATFTFAHQLLFPAGTWTFDPATDRLVQLYPERFWIAAALGYCTVLIAIAAAGYRVARRRSS